MLKSRSSICSLLIQLVAQLSTTVDIKQLKQLLSKATAVIGPPGSGKTTTIINNHTNQTQIVSMTKDTIQNLN